ncbi:unnamed protein product [Leptosia nina]|uniref:Peptidase M12A domain-containing protein n=1 Tax=Leptosia nina TaxID=320188 RepID=A0AAV1JY09_9NEOP
MIFGSVELFEGGQHRQHGAMMVMAMLGFYFEVSREDRDTYIRVHNRHIRPDKLHHFEKIRSDATLPLPYDYLSATHPAWQFWRRIGKRGISTVATYKDKDPNGDIMKSLGQNEDLLSKYDLVKINSVYGVDCFVNQRRMKMWMNLLLQKYRLAFILAIIRNKPDDISVEGYISSLRSKMCENINDFGITEDDFNLSDETNFMDGDELNDSVTLLKDFHDLSQDDEQSNIQDTPIEKLPLTESNQIGECSTVSSHLSNAHIDFKDILKSRDEGNLCKQTDEFQSTVKDVRIYDSQNTNMSVSNDNFTHISQSQDNVTIDSTFVRNKRKSNTKSINKNKLLRKASADKTKAEKNMQNNFESESVKTHIHKNLKPIQYTDITEIASNIVGDTGKVIEAATQDLSQETQWYEDFESLIDNLNPNQNQDNNYLETQSVQFIHKKSKPIQYTEYSIEPGISNVTTLNDINRDNQIISDDTYFSPNSNSTAMEVQQAISNRIDSNAIVFRPDNVSADTKSMESQSNYLPYDAPNENVQNTTHVHSNKRTVDVLSSRQDIFRAKNAPNSTLFTNTTGYVQNENTLDFFTQHRDVNSGIEIEIMNTNGEDSLNVLNDFPMGISKNTLTDTNISNVRDCDKTAINNSLGVNEIIKTNDFKRLKEDYSLTAAHEINKFNVNNETDHTNDSILIHRNDDRNFLLDKVPMNTQRRINELNSFNEIELTNESIALNEKNNDTENSLNKFGFENIHSDEENALTESQAEIVPFKVMEELSKVKHYLNKLDVTDSGFRSIRSNSASQYGFWLNQSSHCLFAYLSQTPLLVSTMDINYDIAKFLKNDENVDRILLLNKSHNIIKFTLEKINKILVNFQEHLERDLIELENVEKAENVSYIFHLLETLLKRYSAENLSQSLSQEGVFKKSTLTDIWRKKWSLCKAESEREIAKKKDILEECSDVLNRIIVKSMNGYSLVAYAALECFNVLQN